MSTPRRRRPASCRSLPLPKPSSRIQLQEYALVGVVALILIVGRDPRAGRRS